MTRCCLAGRRSVVGGVEERSSRRSTQAEPFEQPEPIESDEPGRRTRLRPVAPPPPPIHAARARCRPPPLFEQPRAAECPSAPASRPSAPAAAPANPAPVAAASHGAAGTKGIAPDRRRRSRRRRPGRRRRPTRRPPAVVLPMARNPIRPEAPAAVTGRRHAQGLDRLLRLAAARGASTLYLATDGRPSVRVDGENQALEGEPMLVGLTTSSRCC